ncbi:MAG: hypothetical protein V4850_08480 [Myxococcota bacterium]
MLTRDDTDPSIGDHQWLVYEGTGTGFVPTPVPWTLPALKGDSWAVEVPWYWTHTETWRFIGESDYSYDASTLDLSGDGVLDLVLTFDGVDRSVGAEHWSLYEGTEDGFNETATAWVLPELPGTYSDWSGPWYTTDAGDWAEREVDGVETRYSWSTLDFTGDAVPDLVLTSDDADLAIGDERWNLYAGCP